MKKFIKNLIRLLWYIPYRILKFLRCGRVLYIPIGWDTLYPLAPYSEGGIPRKDFLELYRKGKITTEEYHEKEYGKWDEIANHYEFWQRKYEYQTYLAKCWI
ncbi:MAG: hypothetical protein WCL02_08085 [bacterium]